MPCSESSQIFNSLDKIYRTPDTHERIPTEQLVRDFPVEFPYSDDPLTWFEYEFKEVMGVDLYGYE